MLRVEFKICKKCGKTYTWTSGGIVAGPNDYKDPGLCEKCRAKSVTGKIKKIIDIITE